MLPSNCTSKDADAGFTGRHGGVAGEGGDAELHRGLPLLCDSNSAGGGGVIMHYKSLSAEP